MDGDGKPIWSKQFSSPNSADLSGNDYAFSVSLSPPMPGSQDQLAFIGGFTSGTWRGSSRSRSRIANSGTLSKVNLLTKQHTLLRGPAARASTCATAKRSGKTSVRDSCDDAQYLRMALRAARLDI